MGFVAFLSTTGAGMTAVINQVALDIPASGLDVLGLNETSKPSTVLSPPIDLIVRSVFEDHISNPTVLHPDSHFMLPLLTCR